MRLTKASIQQINKYCQKMLPAWRKKISPNIVGVHYGKKTKERENKILNRYAIVFHIEQKFPFPQKKIPAVINMKFKSGEKKEIPTDVIETGITKLTLVRPGDMAAARGHEDDFGAAGFFFRKNGVLYVCSNMHVLAPQFLGQGNISIPLSQQIKTNVTCFNDTEIAMAFLEKGSFEDIDIAIARIEDETLVSTRIKGIGLPNGFAASVEEGMELRFFSSNNGRVKKLTVRNTGVSKTVGFGHTPVTFNNLVQTNRAATFGDSGSVVVNDSNEIAGIIVGNDEIASYFFPVDTIIDFIKPD